MAGPNTWTGTQNFTGATVTGVSGGAYTWTAKTANYTAVSGDAVVVDCFTASPTITLPTGTTGARVLVARIDSNNLTNGICTVTGTGVTEVLQPGQVVEFLWDGTRWDVRQTPNAGVLVKPRMLNADDKVGARTRTPTTSIRAPYRQPLFIVNATTDFEGGMFKTPSSSPSTFTSGADTTDPYNPNGSPKMTTTVSGGAIFTGNAIKWLPTPVDMTGATLRLIQKLTTLAGSATTDIISMRIELSSDRFVTGAYHYAFLPANQIPGGLWHTVGSPISNFTAQSGGADLTAVNAVRLCLNVQNSGSFEWAFHSLELLPPVSPKAKCVLWFDDGYPAHWTGTYPLLQKYGWVGALAPNIGQDDGLTPEQLRRMQRTGWQIGSHSYSSAEHTSQSGDKFRQLLQKIKEAHAAYGLTGGEDFAFWGGLGWGDDQQRAIQQAFRSARFNTSGSTYIETLPPIHPHWTGAYLQSDAEAASNLTAFVDRAIAAKGLAQFVFHNQASQSPNLVPLLDYLDSKRSVIDVVTFEEAIQPYLATSPMPALPYTVPAQVSAVTAQALPNSVALSWPRPASGGAPIRRYAVYRGTVSGSLTFLANVDATAAAEPIYTDSTVAAGTTYFYTVRARNAAGDGPASGEVSVTAVSTVTRPTTPATTAQPAGWWKVSDATSPVVGSSFGLPDASGNGKGLGAGGRYIANALNGLGAAQHLSSVTFQIAKAAIPVTAQDITVLLVARVTLNTSVTQTLVCSVDTNFTNTNTFNLRRNATGWIEAGAGRTANVGSSTYRLAANTWAVISASLGSAANSHRAKVGFGGQDTAVTPPAYTAAGAQPNFGIGGALQADGPWADMDWTECVVFTSELSDADRKAWEVYLGSANGLPVYGY